MLEEIQRAIAEYYTVVGHQPTTLRLSPDMLSRLRSELSDSRMRTNGMTVLGLAITIGAPRETFYVE